jgi:hypothetical protein
MLLRNLVEIQRGVLFSFVIEGFLSVYQGAGFLLRKVSMHISLSSHV